MTSLNFLQIKLTLYNFLKQHFLFESRNFHLKKFISISGNKHKTIKYFYTSGFISTKQKYLILNNKTKYEFSR